MHNSEYNTYQQYQRFEAMKKIFSVLRTDHLALLNITSRDKCKEISSVRGQNDSQKKYFESADIFLGNAEYNTWKDNRKLFSIDGQKIISAKIFLKVRTFLTSLLNITYNSKRKDLKIMT